MMTRGDFYAKTLVAQVKAYKRFGDDELLYNAFDTLNQAVDKGVTTNEESIHVVDMISDYLFNMRIPSVFTK